MVSPNVNSVVFGFAKLAVLTKLSVDNDIVNGIFVVAIYLS